MTLRWVPGWNGLTEPEAVSYVAAVEAADGQELEFGVAKAINDFVLGCKNDGIWDAIKASCILAGARTLDGALVPLVGTAPIPTGFVAGDYNRKTGLLGATSGKYLDPQRTADADPQNSHHLAVYSSQADTAAGAFFVGHTSLGDSGASGFFSQSDQVYYASRTPGGAIALSNAVRTGLLGVSRSTSSSIEIRQLGATTSHANVSAAPASQAYLIYTRTGQAPSTTINARLTFYSIGESLDLAALDTRVSALITAIGAAIP